MFVTKVVCFNSTDLNTRRDSKIKKIKDYNEINTHFMTDCCYLKRKYIFSFFFIVMTSKQYLPYFYPKYTHSDQIRLANM